MNNIYPLNPAIGTNVVTLFDWSCESTGVRSTGNIPIPVDCAIIKIHMSLRSSYNAAVDTMSFIVNNRTTVADYYYALGRQGLSTVNSLAATNNIFSASGATSSAGHICHYDMTIYDPKRPQKHHNVVWNAMLWRADGSWIENGGMMLNITNEFPAIDTIKFDLTNGFFAPPTRITVLGFLI